MDVDPERENRPYEETLEAARLLEEMTRSAGKPPASPQNEPPPSKTETDRGAPLGAERPEGPEGAVPTPGGKEKPAERSIGELFSKLVKMSPPDKILVEKGSIGSLFKKYIGKRG